MKQIKNISLIFLCFCSPIIIKAQSDSSFKSIKSIKGNFSNFAVDNLDNLYLITGTNQLKKLNSNGDSAGIFNDVKRYGNPSSIDVSNPMKVLLYYKNYSTVVVLDRFLNVRNSINFRRQNIFSVKAISTSYDNNIWLFDEQDYKLKKIDEEGKLLQETVDTRILLDDGLAPSKIIDRENFVYIYDTAKGFYIFDYYGGYKNKIPLLNWHNVEVNANTIYGFGNNKLYSYQVNTSVQKEYKLPAFFGKYNAVKVMNGKVYLLKSESLDIYQVK